MHPVLRRNNVAISGAEDAPAIVFSHGFGCDQAMWSGVAPAFVDDYRVILYDHTGAGGSDLEAYDRDRYASLDGYARDLVEIGEALDLSGATFVGHSVAAMIGVLAHRMAPNLFRRLVFVVPSPRYIDDADYRGGFSRADIEELLDSLASNYLGWSRTMAHAIAGNPNRPQVGEALEASFCRTDPEIAEQFARVTFLSDNRSDLAAVDVDTLILQSADDFVAPLAVGAYVHRAIPRSRLVVLDTHGHCPHLSDPELVIAALEEFIP